MAPVLHFVRHAEGVHNLSVENEAIHDPDLTPRGLRQCAELRATFPFHKDIRCLVASPMRRTLHTCIEAFGREELYPIAALDLLQEVSDASCDTGSERDVLTREFGHRVAVDMVRADWTMKGSDGLHEPAIIKLHARAKEARHVLRKLVQGLDTDSHIVVVSHGGFLPFLTGDWQEMTLTPGEFRSGSLTYSIIQRITDCCLPLATGWANCEYRSYKFVDLAGDDNEAALREISESRHRHGRSRSSALECSQTASPREVQNHMIPFLKGNP